MSAVESRLPEATVRQTLRTVWALLGDRLRALAAVVAAFTVGSAAALAVPALQGRIVDDVIDGHGLGRLSLTVGGIVVAGVVAAVLLLWGGRLLVHTLQDVLAGLREDVLEAAVNLDTTDVENAGSSDVVSRVTGDVESVTTAVTEVLPRTTQALFTLLVTALGFAVLDPWLALAALVAVPVQLLSGTVFLRRSRPLYIRQQRMDAERGQALIETVNGSETVCAHTREDARLGLIAERSLASVEIGRAATKVRNVFNGGLNTAEFLGLAAVICVGFWRVDAGALTVGAATAGALFFQRIFAPVSVLLASIDDLQRAEVGLARLVGVLVARHTVQEPQTVPDCGGRSAQPVEIRDVSFRYGGTGAGVDHVTLSIPAGCRVVLVGASGSGKSTLARLIAGSLRPDRGSVTVGRATADNAVTADGTPACVLVTQELHQFSQSVADNLRLAAPDATDAELLAALAVVAPERGESLDLDDTGPLDESVLQLLALARVLLADPPVIVLDEATAHAGTGDALARLDAAVNAVTAGRTSVIVAHQLSQAHNADLVVVLDRGTIAEAGTHTDLLAREGHYSRLWDAWQMQTP
ncbi:ABC transporter ATP-binding protein [Corynebacterium glyciniphilum]|uniref:ABC transporter ATP-binding protein n=1 Tax=Corynebacterium glyciniphilum TaxID=1404244 RepID=UPI0011AB5BC9|nr:ABC transporter ATP-binding protein [Corynebacterium glyciniphilum]